MSHFLNNNNSSSSSSSSSIFNDHIVNNLLTKYDKIMLLKIFVDSNDENLKFKYIDTVNNHNNKVIHLDSHHFDSGFDLFAPGNEGEELEQYGINMRFFGVGWQDRTSVNKLDFKVSCSAKMVTDSGKVYSTGYYMYPRSSLSKTHLRLANSVGIIDAGYRGHLTGMFDVVNIDNSDSDLNNIEADFWGKKYDRYVQICAPGLVPFLVEIVNTIEELGGETTRGSGGFGSTGR